MRIACPSCAAEYDVPESRVKPGKMVRCARCGGEWMAADEADENVVGSVLTTPAVAAQPEPQREPQPEPQSEPQRQPAASRPATTAPGRTPASRSSPPSRVMLVGAWALTAFVLIGAVVAVVVWRDAVVRIWPPSGRILASAHDSQPKAAQTPVNGGK